MFKKSRRRSKQTGSLRSHRSTGSNTSSSVGTLRGILKLPPSHVRADHASVGGGSSGGSRSTNTKPSVALRKVSFCTITFREFERVIGDNPSCSSGAPIGIGWAHGKDETQTVDEYESERLPRREQPDLVLSRQEREELLVEWGASFQDIIDSIRTSIRIKNQRRSTVNAIGRYDRWEEMMESAGRKIKRTIGLQKDQYVPMVPPPTHHYNQDKHLHHPHTSHQPHPHGHPVQTVVPQNVLHQNVVPKKPERRTSTDTQPSKYAATHVSREFMESTNAQNRNFVRHAADDDDEHAPPSLIASSAVSDISNQDEQDRPKLNVQESGSSYDSCRPAELIEVDPAAADDCDKSVYTMQSGITMSEHGDAYSDAGDTYSSDGFGRLERDTSYWMVGGMDAPRLLRCYNPTVINEDGSYENMIPPAIENWQYQGFGLQPPPYSNSIINRWE